MPDITEETRSRPVTVNPATPPAKPFNGLRYTVIRLGGVLVFASSLHVAAGWLARQTF